MLASGISQQFQHGVDEEMINIINSIIIILTGIFYFFFNYIKNNDILIKNGIC